MVLDKFISVRIYNSVSLLPSSLSIRQNFTAPWLTRFIVIIIADWWFVFGEKRIDKSDGAVNDEMSIVLLQFTEESRLIARTRYIKRRVNSRAS